MTAPRVTPARPRASAASAASASAASAPRARRAARARARGAAQTFVVTGGARGIGYALCGELLARGCGVVLTGRDEGRAREAAAALNSRAGAGARAGAARAYGVGCEVSDADSVAALDEAAEEALGGPASAWVCNAGTNGYVYRELLEMDPAVVGEVIGANAVGTLLSARQALRSGARHVFLMEGAGSAGEPTRKYAAYGYSKAGYRQLVGSLNAELKALESDARVHALSPGLVRTAMTSPGDDAFGSTGRFFVNAVAEEPAAVAQFLAPRLVAVAAGGCAADVEESQLARVLGGLQAQVRGHERIEFLTPGRLLQKVGRRLALGENKDRFSVEDEEAFRAAKEAAEESR